MRLKIFESPFLFKKEIESKEKQIQQLNERITTLDKEVKQLQQEPQDSKDGKANPRKS